MPTKLSIIVIHSALVAILVSGCDSGRKLDAYELLERPPQVGEPQNPSQPVITDETAIKNGLGKNVKLLGKKSAPIIKLNLDFDNTWSLVQKALKHHHIEVTDHDREQGYLLVNFDTDAYLAKEGFFEGLGDRLFADSFGVRKYQLVVKQKENNTYIKATDLGGIATEADMEEGVDEVIDAKVKGPEDSEFRLISLLYNSLRDGFIEPGLHDR